MLTMLRPTASVEFCLTVFHTAHYHYQAPWYLFVENLDLEWPSLECIQDSPCISAAGKGTNANPLSQLSVIKQGSSFKGFKPCPMANLSRKLAAVQNKKGCFPSLIVFQVLRLGVISRRRLFYSGLMGSISGGSLVWAWPEVWALTPTRGRPHEQAQGKRRKSHLCDTMAIWPPFYHLRFNHII